jgi:endonuclease/exonuclease/phosphatase family metal-dependent hydrolase
VLAVAAGLAQRHGVVPDRYIAAAFPLATVLALLYFVPPPASRAADARDGITILSYNIHHGFDDAGMPGMQRIAREIANMNPDLIALQEIGRGWTLVGGNDLVAYLQWRFPEHRIHFTSTNGQLWGNAVMSRLPVIAATGGSFSAEPGILKYGWSGVIVSYDDMPFPFYSVHLTADLEGSNGDPRTVQASELLQVTSSAGAQLIAGDFNAHPEDEPIQLLAATFHDLGSAAGLGQLSTWPAGRPNERIDYVFAREFTVRSGSIPRTLASDHLPVLLHVQPERR